MGRDLMKVDAFKKSIERADEILKPFNISASRLLESEEEGIFNDVQNSCIGIICTQVRGRLC